MARSASLVRILLLVTGSLCITVEGHVHGANIDECATNTHNCNDHAKCIDTIDSYTCTCNPGYSGDGVNCGDIDECELGTHNCSDAAECENSPPGAFTCVCNEGYSGDGFTCDDIDECSLGLDNCNDYAKCVNNVGSFICTSSKASGGDNKCRWEQQTSSVSGVTGSSFNTFKECTYETGSQINEQHYTSLDGQRYKFQGDGFYVLTESTAPGLPHFMISSENNFEIGTTPVAKRKRKRRKWGFWLVIGSFSLCIGNKFKAPSTPSSSSSSTHDTNVLINGVDQNMPINYVTEDKRTIRVSNEPDGIKVTTDIGVTIDSCGLSGITVRLSREYRGKVRGMLGDFDGNQGDDMKLPNGRITKDAQKFGEAWRDTYQDASDADSKCSSISDPAGPFSSCHSKLDPKHFAEICHSDVCGDGSAEAICDIFNNYACKCADRGVIVDWRTDAFCPPLCGDNAHYALQTTPCVNTCMNPSAEQNCHVQNLPVSGCVCDDGHVLSDDTCVPLDQCGCIQENVYYKIGDVWSKDCDTICTCTGYNTVECEDIPGCMSDMTCSPQADGSSICVCDQTMGCAPECSKHCSVTESGTLQTPVSLGSQLSADTNITLTSTGDGTDQCKVRITVLTNSQGGVQEATVSTGTHVTEDFANNFIFNGNVNMRPAMAGSAPVNFPFAGWDDGSVFVSITEINPGSRGWILNAICGQGQGSEHLVTFTFASQNPDVDYVTVYVSDPNEWTEQCFG